MKPVSIGLPLKSPKFQFNFVTDVWHQTTHNKQTKKKYFFLRHHLVTSNERELNRKKKHSSVAATRTSWFCYDFFRFLKKFS